ncbi:MAG TPA: hypothetical protein VMS64_32940 [Candidatus Methylomirabilis sp.]|nr:hypothetical protein [Candidatus Methylomirabilis sp.]
MFRRLVLALLVVVSFDLSTPDAIFLPLGGRSVQWDDEEESVPARRQRVGAEERRVEAFPVTPRPVEPAPRSTVRRAHADRLDGQSAWKVPIRQALTPSVRSVSPPDDH